MTAVEWLEKELIKHGSGAVRTFGDLFEQAKEMENEQREITWNNAIDAQLKDKWDSYDDFNNKTFKSE